MWHRIHSVHEKGHTYNIAYTQKDACSSFHLQICATYNSFFPAISKLNSLKIASRYTQNKQLIFTSKCSSWPTVLSCNLWASVDNISGMSRCLDMAWEKGASMFNKHS